VSNFDDDLMRQTLSVALPHAVQNWLDPTHADNAVLRFCREYRVFYQVGS
jgi:diketogulonate reductase-like aldo/keto reductase